MERWHCSLVKERDEDLVKLLLEAKLDANVEDKLGRLVAVPYGNKKVVKLLLGAKADVNLKASCNRICSCSWKVMTALCLAAYKGDEAMVKLLLEAKARREILLVNLQINFSQQPPSQLTYNFIYLINR